MEGVKPDDVVEAAKAVKGLIIESRITHALTDERIAEVVD